MMDHESPESPPADEYFVMRRGDFVGPMTLDDLRFGMEEGRIAPGDLVQRGKTPLWHRAENVIAGSAGLDPSATPNWSVILAAVRQRLSRDMRTASVATGVAFLAIGLAAWLLSHWPVALWLPWFLPPVIAGVLALTRGRLQRGLLLLLPVALVPALYVALRPMDSTPAPAASTAHVHGEPRLTEAPPPVQPELLPPAAEIEAPITASPPAEPILAEVRQLPPLPAETPVALKPDPKPASRSLAPDELIQAHENCFVVVSDDAGQGSGFICSLDGRTVLLTNTHVMAGMRQPRFSQLDGTQVAVGGADAAAGADLMRLALTSPPAQPLEAMTELEKNARIGDDVVVLGNTGGGGVVTSLEGKLLGIGPDRIEVSSEFIPGNSGSPIVHMKSGLVIGIATFLTQRYEEFGASSPGARPGGMVVRRFGYRLDTVARWEPVNWATFQAEAAQLRKISELTADVFDFLGAVRAGREPQFSTDTLRRPAMDWVGKAGRSGVSEADRRNATQSFLGALRLMVRTDVATAEAGLRYSYFREELRKEREVRDKLYKSFDDEVRRMTSPSGRGGF